MNDDLLTIDQAAREAGMPKVTLRRRVDRFGVELLRDPRDLRIRLIRRSDLAKLLEVRPVAARKEAAAA